MPHDFYATKKCLSSVVNLYKFPRLPWVAGGICALSITNCYGATPEISLGLCHAPPPVVSRYTDFSLSATDPASTSTQMVGDQATGEGDIYTLTGNVHVQRGARWLEADSASYNKESDEVNAEGNVRTADELSSITGESAQFNLSTDQGHVDTVKYRWFEGGARGEAATAIIDSSDQLRLQQATFTTCEAGHEAWRIYANSVKLDNASGFGTASAALLTFKNVPIMFLPYMTFPINAQRKSGFLLPSMGNSKHLGTTIALPYYLNLAPNYDATVTARSMTKRGVQLENELRYITQHQRGLLRVDYLPKDDVAGEDRLFAAYRHSARLGQNGAMELNLNHVSDVDYFKDFGNSLSQASTSYVEERLDLSYARGSHSLIGRLQGYEMLDRTTSASSRPYRLLPQLIYTTRTSWDEYNTGLDFRAQLDRFDQRERVDGTRFDVAPSVTSPYQRMWGYSIPRITLRHTQYQLRNLDDSHNTVARTLPVFSVDNGLFFDREFTFAKEPEIQTLEPRLFYVYIPYQDQTTIPLFDTSATTFSFGQMFQENRFSGFDRIGDTNQLTAALTTRFISGTTGAERIRASIGQIFYFSDRQVTLSGSNDTGRKSRIAAEVNATMTDKWVARAELVRNPELGKFDTIGANLRYRDGEGRIFSAYYRYVRDSIDQSDYVFRLPLSSRWHAVGRWAYSYHDERILETFAGLEYDSCCWGLSFVQRKYYTGPQASSDSEYNQSWLIQLKLKGLTSLGDSVDKALDRGILGDRALTSNYTSDLAL